MFVLTGKYAPYRIVLVIMCILGAVSLVGCGQKAPLELPPVEDEDSEAETESETKQTDEDESFILDPLIK